MCCSSTVVTFVSTPLAHTVRTEHIAIGVRVRRGSSWSWGDQDGGAGGTGVVTGVNNSGSGNGWVSVRWDFNENTNQYRWGREGAYDLHLIT